MSESEVLKHFDQVWSTVFSSRIHVDSALSKLPPHVKPTVAQLVPRILRNPASLAQQLGIGVTEGEPWNLGDAELARWRPARLVAGRAHAAMSGAAPVADALPADYPPAMLGEWESRWGRETMLELVSVLGGEAPLSLRASRKLGAAKLLAELTEGNRLPVKAGLSGIAPLGVRLARYAPVMGTASAERGELEIQDEGSQLMALFALWPELYAPLLGDRPGRVREERVIPLPPETPAWTVVDACAGAGGKSLAMADALGGKGRVFAYDVSATKLQGLRRRATRAGLNNIQAVLLEEGNESEVTGRFRRRAQAVLVDAPCSGWGVLRRNPDIKWRLDGDALDRLPGIQLRLLKEYSQLVAPGGTLTFGVCTFREAETVDVVARFLDSAPEFEPGPGGYLGPGPCDGFYMHGFKRRRDR